MSRQFGVVPDYTVSASARPAVPGVAAIFHAGSQSPDINTAPTNGIGDRVGMLVDRGRVFVFVNGKVAIRNHDLARSLCHLGGAACSLMSCQHIWLWFAVEMRGHSGGGRVRVVEGATPPPLGARRRTGWDLLEDAVSLPYASSRGFLSSAKSTGEPRGNLPRGISGRKNEAKDSNCRESSRDSNGCSWEGSGDGQSSSGCRDEGHCVNVHFKDGIGNRKWRRRWRRRWHMPCRQSQR